MRTARPKVLHEVAGLSMLEHVVASASICARRVLLVLSQETAEAVRTRFPQPQKHNDAKDDAKNDILQTVQRRQDGTGGAAACALAYAAEQGLPAASIVFLNGDAPLVSKESLRRLVRLTQLPLSGAGEGEASFALLGFASDAPFGYGRLLGRGLSATLDGSSQECVEAVREEVDCTPDERALPFCNAGVYSTRLGLDELRGLLARLPARETGRAKSLPERRMTDLVEAYEGKVAVCWTSEQEARGVNTPSELEQAERLWQERKRRETTEQGVRMLAPHTVFFSHDTAIGKGTVIEPYVVFGEKVSIGEDVKVGSFSHLEGARIAAHASVGPFARLRPTSTLGYGAKVGNFVETKNATLGRQAKASHLAYLGDCSVGEAANIGAGVITCNYDGKNKHRTQIGAGAFVGSNSSLIAPLSIGERACIGASSAIADDVAADTLVFERSAVSAKPLGKKSASASGKE